VYGHDYSSSGCEWALVTQKRAFDCGWALFGNHAAKH